MSPAPRSPASPTPPTERVDRWSAMGLGAALFAATLLAYLPTLSAGFIWNDADYVTSPALRSLSGLWRIWFEVGATEQYYPLLHSAFWFQHRLWGDTPAYYHLLNVLLHATSACLFAAVLRRLAVPGAWLAAFVFALHPVCVESVAWIAEQKNTQSLVLYLLAALAYLCFDAERRPGAYVTAFVCFALALLSKTTTATLPAALLVVFWWRRGRLEWHRDVRPLLPWFVVGAAMGLLSAWVEKKFIGAEGAEFALTLWQRGALAGRIVWFYLGKLFWPDNLIFIYPRWIVDASAAWWWLFSAGAVAALGGLWWLRSRWRAPLAVALLFGGSLFPVLGFFNVYGFIFSFVADHWQYLPCLGVIALAAAGLTHLLARFPSAVRWIVPALLLATLGTLSWRQSRMYADMETFYRTTLAQNPGCWMAHNNLGNLLRESGRIDEAIGHFEQGLALTPASAKAHNNLANALLDRQRLQEAGIHYERALALQPDFAHAHNNLATVLRDTGQSAAALAHHATAVRIDPRYADAFNNYGVTLRQLGRLPEALAQFSQAARLDPNSAPAQLNLALVYSMLGQDAESATHYREARRLNPALPDLSAPGRSR
ncbi:MAG: tetratricopeptide repeat protein [Opitutae bacterium]|nr:tetratricopeptide repeat protein [Opitutae bacterium]